MKQYLRVAHGKTLRSRFSAPRLAISILRHDQGNLRGYYVTDNVTEAGGPVGYPANEAPTVMGPPFCRRKTEENKIAKSEIG